jgi:hypothetical protein
MSYLAYTGCGLLAPGRKTVMGNPEHGMRDQVLVWLRDTGWSEISEKTQKGFRWVIQAKSGSGPFISFVQPDEIMDGLYIRCALQFQDGVIKLIRTDRDCATRFFSHLFSLLISTGIEHEISAALSNHITLVEAVYFDENNLSKHRFMSGVRRMSMGIRAVMLACQCLTSSILEEGSTAVRGLIN